MKELGIEDLKDGAFRARKSLAYTLSHLFKDQEQISFTEEFRHLAYDLTHPEEFPMQKLNIQAELRDYQKR